LAFTDEELLIKPTSNTFWYPTNSNLRIEGPVGSVTAINSLKNTLKTLRKRVNIFIEEELYVRA